MAEDFNFELLGFMKPKDYFKDDDFRKERITQLNIYNMLRRTAKMFEWKGLPETIPQRHLELLVQSKGVCGFIKQNEKLYVVYGQLGGVPNYNYMPTWFIVSNPYLKITSKTYNIYENIDCVIFPNDSLYQGLMPLLSYHSELLTEIQLTKRCVMITHRSPVMATAPSNNDKEAIDGFFKDLENGKIKSIYDKNFLQQINAIQLNANSHNIITQVLEMEQYQKASMFNDIGLQMNYNMKRETITSSEAQLGESALLPLCDDMYEMRKICCKQLKDIFDVDISVEFSSAWRDLRKSIQVEMAISEKELSDNQSNTLEEEEDNEIESDIGDIENDGNGVSDNTDNSDVKSEDGNEPNVQKVDETSTVEAEQIVEIIEQIVENVVENGNEKTD